MFCAQWCKASRPYHFARLSAWFPALTWGLDIMAKSPLGYIAYQGPSLIDGAPIVVIINKVHSASANDKTGAMVQSFIIRSDIAPMAAIASGADESICGACPHRPLLARASGAAPCYVQVAKSVNSVYEAYKRGRYQVATPAELSIILAGKMVRIGTYGDGAAAPVEMWRTIVSMARGHAGYSHQWQRADFDHSAWAPLVMASADTLEESALANLHGMRTFRVSIGLDVQSGEISCPASSEGGRKSNCAKCGLCGGTSKSAKDIVIADHAAGHAKRVINIQVAV